MSDSKSSALAISWPPTVVGVVLVLLLGAAVFLPDLGQEIDLLAREDRHAEIAREMVQSGLYIVPSVCGRPYVDKPPLFNWTVALLFRLTGRIDLFVARLPSALCAIAAMLGIFVLGRRWLSARAGLLAAVVWATSWLVVEWGRGARMDMMMACLILYAVVLADVAASARAGWRQAAPWGGACVLIGAATLAKGPVAILFFGIGVMALWRARCGRWLPPLRLLLTAIVVVGALLSAWALTAERSRPGHLWELIEYQFGVAVAEHPKRVWLYFEKILVRTLPWSLFAAGAGWWAVRRSRTVGYDLTAIPALIVAVGLATLTLLSNKREHFMLPILPMWALMVGGFIDVALAHRASASPGTGAPPEAVPRWAFDWPLLGGLVVVLAVALAGAGMWLWRAHGGKLVGMAVFATVFALAAYGVLAVRRRHSTRATVMLVGGSVILAVTGFPLLTRFVVEPSSEVLGQRQMAAAIPPEAPLAACSVELEYLYFKLNRPIVFVQDQREASTFVNGPGIRYLIIVAGEADRMSRLAHRPLRKVGRWVFGDSAVALLATEPPCNSTASNKETLVKGRGHRGPGLLIFPRAK